MGDFSDRLRDINNWTSKYGRTICKITLNYTTMGRPRTTTVERFMYESGGLSFFFYKRWRLLSLSTLYAFVGEVFCAKAIQRPKQGRDYWVLIWRGNWLRCRYKPTAEHSYLSNTVLPLFKKKVDLAVESIEPFFIRYVLFHWLSGAGVAKSNQPHTHLGDAAPSLGWGERCFVCLFLLFGFVGIWFLFFCFIRWCLSWLFCFLFPRYCYLCLGSSGLYFTYFRITVLYLIFILELGRLYFRWKAGCRSDATPWQRAMYHAPAATPQRVGPVELFLLNCSFSARSDELVKSFLNCFYLAEDAYE